MLHAQSKRAKDAAAGDADQQEKKRLQNRLAQQAFRRRQAESLRQLRNAANQAPESEQLASLQRENVKLRTQLVEVQGKLNSLLAAMQTLSSTVSHALDDNDNDNDNDTGNAREKIPETKKQIECVDQGPLGDGLLQGHHHRHHHHHHQLRVAQQAPRRMKRSKLTSPLALLDLSTEDFLQNGTENGVDGILSHHYHHHHRQVQQQQQHHQQPDQLGSQNMATASISIFDKNPLDQHLPDIWTFEYQMGPPRYLDAISSSSPPPIRQAWQSNSPFSDHIDTLQSLLKMKLDRPNMLSHVTSESSSLYQPVLTVLAMFNSLTRPDVMAWYAKTRFYHIVELTAWELRPCSATFERIHQVYRPTQMQLEHQDQYPRVINWIPFPPIRNRLIQLHAANPNIDQVFCDAVSGYVVEATLSDLVIGPPIKVYVRVTDLINSMNMNGASPASQQQHEKDGGSSASTATATTAAAAAATADNDGTKMTLPAPDVTTLFSCPTYAKAAFYFLNMDKGASFYKVDPAFYDKYPELWDPSSNVMAQGIPLKPDVQAVLTYPQPLNPSIVETYRSFIDFSIDGFDRLTLL